MRLTARGGECALCSPPWIRHCSRYNQFDVTHTILQVQSEYEEYSYSVKVINPNDKGGYQVEQLQTKYPKLTTVEQIRSELTEQLKGFIDGASCEFFRVMG